jgi:hypothetical protein
VPVLRDDASLAIRSPKIGHPTATPLTANQTTSDTIQSRHDDLIERREFSLEKADDIDHS